MQTPADPEDGARLYNYKLSLKADVALLQPEEMDKERIDCKQHGKK